MRLLLDTHVIIWALTDDERLSDYARKLIMDPENIVCFSIASIWEIAIKNYKAPEKCPFNEEEIADLCRKSGYEQITIQLSHIQKLRGLKTAENQIPANFDPFDRILMAQAKAEGMKLLSHDTNFDNYDESCILKI